MKKTLIILIKTYQQLISPTLKQLLGERSFCKYPQTCSEYAKETIEKRGALRGSVLSLKRILSCSSYSKPFLSLKINKI